jgi:4-hydroxy-2-oxoheptanedioate aldolase
MRLRRSCQRAGAGEPAIKAARLLRYRRRRRVERRKRMGENQIKERWRQGKAVVNGWLAIPSGFSAEVMSQCGWNSVTVDLQHGIQDYLSMVACFQAMQSQPVTRLVRVPWNEPGIIGKVLDAGAYGVICPMINTKAQAEAFVSACKYPPQGTRSNGPVRAIMYAAGNYQKTANDEVLVLPMIETREALDNLEAILDTPGIDAIYIGPSDLGFSLGLVPKLDREEPEVLAIYERLIAETRKRGIRAGIHCGAADYAVRMLKLGFRLVTITNDAGLMAKAARQAVADVWKDAGELR